MRIAVISGGRSDFGLIAPLWAWLLDKSPDTHIIRLDEECFASSDNLEGTCSSMGLVMLKLPPILRRGKYDKVVVLGDRFEILSAACCAYTLGIPISHIEGSDTTLGSLDEGYRRAIRVLASEHYDVKNFGSLACIMPEGVYNCDEQYEFVFCYHPWKGDWQQEFLDLVTFYRGGEGVYITANKDAGGQWINEQYRKGGIEPRSYDRRTYLSVLAKARFIVGNSSSGLIEAPQLKVPTFNVGDRQKGRLRGPSIYEDYGDPDLILPAITDFTNPYFRENTLERIGKGILSRE